MSYWNYYTKKGNKYKAEKIEVDGVKFDSKKEANRYQELKLMEKVGLIKNLQMQVKYVLIPAQREPNSVGTRGGVKKGKVIERECAYYADFVYTEVETGETIVEDVKGYRDGGAYNLFKIKRKLMLWVHHIQVKEV